MTMTVSRSLIAAVVILLAAPVLYAQGGASKVGDKDLELFRKDVRSMKKQIVAANIQLTDVEAQKFWPIYDQFSAEASKLYDARYGLIKEYAENIQNLSDAQAASLAKRSTDLDGQMVQLRLKYLPSFEKVIGGKKTALFLQLDRRLALIIDLQLASEIPLVQP